MPFSPVLDSRTLPHHPGSREAISMSKQVPLLSGVTEAEGYFYLMLMDQLRQPGDLPDLVSLLRSAFPLTSDDQAELLTRLVAELKAQGNGDDLFSLLIRCSSELWMWRDVVEQAERRIRQNCEPVYLYRFGWREPFLDGYWAIHGAELPFVFDKLEVNNVWGDEDTLRAREAIDPGGERYVLRDQVISAWTEFARSGVPASRLLPAWPAYSAEDCRVMRLDSNSAVISNPVGADVGKLLAALDVGIGS